MHEPEPIEVIVGRAGGDHVSIRILGRENPGADSWSDANWLIAEVGVAVGVWRGRFRASLGVDEFVGLRRELVPLERDLDGTARFRSCEGWLTLTFDGDGKGHFAVEGEARDDCGIGNALQFHLELDQTELPGLLAQLALVEERYPERARP